MIGDMAKCDLPQTPVNPEMDRRNGRLYLLCYFLIFLSGAIDYVGVVQASLLDRLGASHTVANLPAATYSLGSVVPFLLSPLIPYRCERSAVVIANLVSAASLAAVCITLFFNFSKDSQIAAVIIQGMIIGFSGSISSVYMLQCLGRGTTEAGRSRTFKLTFTFGPILGITGGLATQFILNGDIRDLHFPYDFGLLYAASAICIGGVALVSSRFSMVRLEERERDRFSLCIAENVKSFTAERGLVLLWFAYLFWNFSISGSQNFSLYAQQAVGKTPSSLAGISMALQFAGKSAVGFILGIVAERFGCFAPSKLTVALAGGAMAWAWLAPGYSYLLAFALMGGAALGGVYFPNCVLTYSPATRSAADLAILGLAAPAASIAPVIFGALADLFGFPASFMFGIATSIVALWLLRSVAPLSNGVSGLRASMK